MLHKPSKLRAILAILIFTALVFFVVLKAWDRRPVHGEDAGVPRLSMVEDAQTTLELRMMLGALVLTEQGSSDVTKFMGVAREKIAEALADALNSYASSPPAVRAALTTRIALVAHYAHYPELTKRALNELKELPADGRLPALERRVAEAEGLEATGAADSNGVEVTEEQIQSLGWFSNIARYVLSSDDAARAALKQTVDESARKMTVRATIVGSIIMVGAVISLLSFAYMCYLASSKRLVRRLENRPEIGTYGLEVLCLYLGGMLSASWAISRLGASATSVNPLVANAVLIPILLLFVVWPVLWGVPSRDLWRKLAVFGPSGRQTGMGREIISGLMSYAAFWVPFAPIILVYAFFLNHLGVAPSSGAHPVVPILIKNDNSNDTLWTVLLAVVLAPIIEEIMFRGFLYGWLRERWGIAFSAILTGTVFAVIHPQGAVGVIPLAMIGAVLCLIREWRGNLVAPMVTHACVNGGTLLLVLLLFRA